MQQRKINSAHGKLISIVVPIYNQEKKIQQDVIQVEKSLREVGLRYEIILVNDGSTDRTLSKLKKIRSRNIFITGYELNQGKGYAIKTGMLKAKGDIVGFLDAGTDIRSSGLSMLLNHMDWYNADIIVGSKLHPVSKVKYPLSRKILSFGYRWLTKILFGFKIRDTQVGMKFFKRKVVKAVLPRLVVKKFAFDIEILAVAYLLGFKRIYEAPVEINFKANTINSINMWRIIFNMLMDTVAVFYRIRFLGYYTNKGSTSKKIKRKKRSKIIKQQFNAKKNLIKI